MEDDLRHMIINRLDRVESKIDTMTREVVELKTKVGIFKQWMTGLAAFIGAGFSALMDYITKH